MENKGKVIILSLINIIRSLVLVSQAAIIKELINQACKGQDIFTYALILSLMVFLIIILRILYVLIKNKGELEIEVGMKKKITSALLTKDIARVKEYHSGEITNIALSDITNIKVGECEVIPSFFLLVSRFIFAGVLLVIYDYRLVLILLGFGVLGFLFARLYSRHMKRLQKQSLESDGRMNTFMQETVENISLIKALGSSDSINLGLAKEAESNYLIKSKRNRLQIFGNTSLLSMMNVAVAFTTIYGAFLITQGMEYGTFVALLQLVSYFEYPLTAMSGLLTSFNAYKASKERIAEILSLPEDDTQIEINDFDKIEISHLSFGYDRKIFDDFSTEIQKGETILIKGRSGVGKSTLFSLLLDFRKPKNGEINVCLNQEKHPISACRSLFSYVSQENILFSKSIREN
ncbi:MAG: ABC transporter ATP-binding protein, partial [Bacilli bacterium]